MAKIVCTDCFGAFWLSKLLWLHKLSNYGTLALSFCSHPLLNLNCHHHFSSFLASLLPINTMSSSTVQKICKFCKKSYTGKDHKHERTCRFYVWDIPHHFATKQGPMIHITRRANDRHIFCKCVNSSGEKCDRTFASKSGLDKHLNNVKPVYWVVCELNRTYASPCQPLC